MDMEQLYPSIKASVPSLLNWFVANARDLPWRHEMTPYRIWVSEIMLQQTRVETVIPYYLRFLEKLPTIEALAQVPEPELLKLWEGLGYYSRVRNMQKAAKVIIENHGGQMPQNYESIRALPGIGDYTAGAIASFAFNLPHPAVDGNVLRVLARLCGHEGDILQAKTRKELEAFALQLLPAEYPSLFNQGMIELGALICKPNGNTGGPQCERCPFASVCVAKEKGITDQLPIRLSKTHVVAEERTVLQVWLEDSLLICKRPDTGLLAALYELPNRLGYLQEEELRTWLADWGLELQDCSRLKDAKHVFSHRIWLMQGYRVSVKSTDPLRLPSNARFVRYQDEQNQLAIPMAFEAYTP